MWKLQESSGMVEGNWRVMSSQLWYLWGRFGVQVAVGAYEEEHYMKKIDSFH